MLKFGIFGGIDMDFTKEQIVFKKYLESYDRKDDKIRLKITHTYGVVSACEYIVNDLNLDNEDVELAKLIGLLHDIGRFEQLRRYHSFDDSIMSHAQCSLDILFKDGMIREFIRDNSYDSIIYTAIKYHGVYKMPEDLIGRERLHSQIIRDADKMDNFRVKFSSSIDTLVDVTKEELGKELITERVFEDFMQHKAILNSDRHTHMDMWVSYLGYIFDFNFSSGLKYIKEKGYIQKIIDRVPYTNIDTKEKMKQIQKNATDFIDRQLDISTVVQ